MSTNFPRVFLFDQVLEICDQCCGDKEMSAAAWHPNLRGAAFALGTLLTHCKGQCNQVTPNDAAEASALSDADLAGRVRDALQNSDRRQGILRNSSLLSPAVIALIIELLMRYFSQHHSDIGACFAATAPEAVPATPESEGQEAEGASDPVSDESVAEQPEAKKTRTRRR